MSNLYKSYTVEPANNGHPRDWSKMAVIVGTNEHLLIKMKYN